MLIVFTGNGKGKTTAALGQVMRAVGRGRNVLMVQFIKGPWQSGEDLIEVHRQSDGAGRLVIKKMGLGFVGILGDKLPKEKHAEAARQALAYAKSQLDKEDMLILDEVNVAVSLGLISARDTLESIKDAPLSKIMIFTGRNAPQEFLDAADLVTEMREVKHPFNNGKIAELGIEF
ncbi:MAG: cob(I)yrinic acid a,c-diamide adenosyltransferase [Patescibacteria group bacterium]|nr:cob(I)yrinic acid a,c-diamide adenosyltransferase [Patescibacteria group bacterium]MCL5224279.1 cob(I)yrinic acid a,c-diamide adenosyltransferase [Patescibacteria group bacterium]